MVVCVCKRNPVDVEKEQMLLRSDIWIWFEESFAESVKPSGRNPLSYPILESKLPTIRLKEQTSLNSLYA
ncbi:General Transcription Factor Ii-I [Manis pentadactyla]|nr:General Transcription Factor Ii-I [Manis pentadactyla]